MYRKVWKRLSFLVTLLGVGVFFLSTFFQHMQTKDLFEGDEAAVLMAPPLSKRIQTIVILPGPHKTGTTSAQTELSDWLHTHHPAFANWSWPIPSQAIWQNYTGLVKTQVKFNFHQAKGHALLANRLMGRINSNLLPRVPTLAILEAYRRTLQKDWEAGKSIVIAAEDLDWMAIEEPTISGSQSDGRSRPNVQDCGCAQKDAIQTHVRSSSGHPSRRYRYRGAYLATVLRGFADVTELRTIV